MNVTPLLQPTKSKPGDIPTHFLKAFELMCLTKRMAEVYDENRQHTKYVHSTSRGHEAIQIATGLQLTSSDAAAPYYRDEAMLLAMGWTQYTGT